MTLQSEHNTIAVADTAETVTLDADEVELAWLTVTNVDGADEIYYTFGSGPATPTVAGDDVWGLPAVAGAAKTHRLSGAAGSLKVILISNGTPAYSVEAYD